VLFRLATARAFAERFGGAFYKQLALDLRKLPKLVSQVIWERVC